jgi:hypothetical protein
MPKTNINDIACDGFRAEVSWLRDEFVCPCGTIWANGPGVPSECPECGTQVSATPGHVQIASVNQHSTFEFPPDLLDYGPNGEELRGEPEPFDGWRVTLDEAGIDRTVTALKKARAAAFSPEKDPEVGDRVFLQGQIIHLDEGIALVEVYRSWPLTMRVPVQCGALEHDDRVGDGGTPG